MTIAVRIVAVPDRADRAAGLQATIGGQIVMDAGRDGAFPNHVRAIASAGSATHVVVVEDDAMVCGDFLEHVDRLVVERPDHLLGLYVGRTHPRLIQPVIEEVAAPGWLDDARLTDRLRWAVSYVMPTVDIPAVLDHLAHGGQHAWLGTDTRLGAWHAGQGRLSYPFPSPVDHDDTLPSMTSHGKSGRTAWMHCQA